MSRLSRQWLFPNAVSLGERLDQYKGFGPGFDCCRLYLSLSVVVFHSCNLIVGPSVLTYDPVAHTLGITGPQYVRGYWLLYASVLPMFFALSGFLIAGSAQRLSLTNFLINRGLRIYPALGVEVLLSALMLGPLFTILPLHQYFIQTETYKYLFNLIGFIHYRLPGVFLHNAVNTSLWTVPIEITCYIVMTILIITKTVTKVGWSACAVTVYPLIWFVYLMQFYDSRRAEAVQYFLDLYFHNVLCPLLIPCFLTGISLYVARYRIPYSRTLFVGAIMALLAVAMIGKGIWAYDPVICTVINPLFAYVVVFVGLTKIPKIPFYSTGDYSYGIYLYGYPIQQSLKQLMPNITLPIHQVLSILIVTMFAAFSWHCIEKPILAMRKNFAFITRRRKEEQEMAMNGKMDQTQTIGDSVIEAD